MFGSVCVLAVVPAFCLLLMADMQNQVDNTFAELDVIEEMLRPLVCAKTIHESEEDGLCLLVCRGMW